MSAYGSVFQVADLQQLGQKQESVRTKVCLENQIFVHTMSMLPSSCKSLAQGRIHGTHPTTSPVIQETKTSGWCHNQQVLKERQHWDNNLGSDYQDQSRTSDNMMLLTLSLSGIINNSIEICITTREPDKYTEAQNMNQTKVWLPDIVRNSIQGRENNQGYI